MNALTMLENINENLEPTPQPSTSNPKATAKAKIINLNPAIPSQMELRQSAVRISPAEFSRLMSVSKTTVSNWIKLGKITLHADGTLDAKAAAESLIKKTDPSKLRAKVFKQITNDATTLQNEITRLNVRVMELESALIESNTAKNEWCNDYIQLESTIENFIEQLATDVELKEAVNAGNVDSLQNAFDGLLDGVTTDSN